MCQSWLDSNPKPTRQILNPHITSYIIKAAVNSENFGYTKAISEIVRIIVPVSFGNKVVFVYSNFI